MSIGIKMTSYNEDNTILDKPNNYMKRHTRRRFIGGNITRPFKLKLNGGYYKRRRRYSSFKKGGYKKKFYNMTRKWSRGGLNNRYTRFNRLAYAYTI
jgi:hypothetical protein|tara:strand:- start:3480 stop:3770 length:291 start_codon:yes stop_codon:yes gene_type:complete